MGNPNPYKDVKLPDYFMNMLEPVAEQDRHRIVRHWKFLKHTRDKFEKAMQREYNRNRLLRKQLEDLGITPAIDMPKLSRKKTL